MFHTPLEGALYMVDLGYKVFPLVANGKVPPKGLAWQQWAEACTKEKVYDYGLKHPKRNWAVSTEPSFLTVIDIDPEKGGFESIKALPPLDKTFTVKTRSGGFHLYYKGLDRSSSSSIAKGIDTRGRGGYVVAPGSLVEGKRYELIENIITPELPIWVRTKLQEKKADLDKPSDENVEFSITQGQRDNDMTRWAGTLRGVGLTYDEILAALEVMNETRCNPPLDDHAIKRIAKSVSRYERGDALALSDFKKIDSEEVIALRACDFNMQDQPKRDWIMLGRYIASFLSLIVARGGSGKSMFALLDAISIATGRNYSNFPVIKQSPVWIHNAEDPMVELSGRLLAICQHYEIDNHELSNLHFTSGRTLKIVVARTVKGVAQRNEDAIEWIKTYIKNQGIKVAFFDPLVKMHQVDENSNAEMDVVCSIFSEIAEETKCSICLIHHGNKGMAGNRLDPGANINASRGASSVIDAVRIAHTINTMSTGDAHKLGVSEEERPWFISIDDAKANLSPPAANRNWYYKCPVKLPNGDSYGVLEWDEVKREEHLKRVQAEENDLKHALTKHMSELHQIRLSTLAKNIVQDKELEHLFGSFSRATISRKLNVLLEIPFQVDNHEYRLFTDRGAKNNRVFVSKIYLGEDLLG